MMVPRTLLDEKMQELLAKDETIQVDDAVLFCSLAVLDGRMTTPWTYMYFLHSVLCHSD